MRVDDPAGGTRPRVRRTGGSARVPRELRVSLLGTFAVSRDGVECELPKGARRLVALLALNPRGLPRSDAARELAPQLETESARASLRSAAAQPAGPPQGCGGEGELEHDPLAREQRRGGADLRERIASAAPLRPQRQLGPGIEPERDRRGLPGIPGGRRLDPGLRIGGTHVRGGGRECRRASRPDQEPRPGGRDHGPERARPGGRKRAEEGARGVPALLVPPGRHELRESARGLRRSLERLLDEGTGGAA